MAEQQPSAEVIGLTELFKKLDVEQKGAIPGKDFAKALANAGYTLSPKVLANLRTLFVGSPSEDDPVSYYQFLDAATFLSPIKAGFSASDTSKSGKVPVNNSRTLWKNIGYEFKNPQVADYLAITCDREKSGSITFEGIISGVLFFRFAHTHFAQADSGNKGVLGLEALRDKLPVLGVENASEEEAKRLFKEADTDGSGGIDPEEFAVLVVSLKFPDRAAELWSRG